MKIYQLRGIVTSLKTFPLNLMNFQFTLDLIYTDIGKLKWWQHCTADDTVMLTSSLMIRNIYKA